MVLLGLEQENVEKLFTQKLVLVPPTQSAWEDRKGVYLNICQTIAPYLDFSPKETSPSTPEGLDDERRKFVEEYRQMVAEGPIVLPTA